MTTTTNEDKRTLSDALLYAAQASRTTSVLRERAAEQQRERIEATPIAPYLAAVR